MKRLTIVTLCFLLLVGVIGGSVASALWIRTGIGWMGDVDGDSAVTTTDARLTLQFASKKADFTEDQIRLALVNGGEAVTTTDARLILQFAAKKIDTFPCGTTRLYDSVVRSEPETTPNPDPDSFSKKTSGNPIFTSIFTADPSAHVWEDGRLYVYPSHDIFPAQGCDLMNKYHVFSTDNMVDWVDEGEILSSDDVEWGRPEGGFMWAPDCAYKDGTYYFYYPHPCESDWNATWRIGVATSDKPASDFTDQGMMKNADGKTAVGEGKNSYTGKDYYSFIDPCVFEDDDGTFYLTVGGGGDCYIAKLSDDMMTLAEELRPLSELEAFHEGSWLFKENGIYYLVYADGGNKNGDCMRYATADNPYGPYTNRGILIDPVQDSSTSHGSVVEYKGNWYLFYHNAAISGNGALRCVCVDRLYFNEDGSIKQVVQTKTGVEAVGPASESTEGPGTGLLVNEGDTDRYSVKTNYGLDNATVVNAGFNGDHTCVENMHVAGAKLTFSGIDGGKGGKALVTIYYGSAENATAKVESTGGDADGYFLKLPGTGGWGNYTGAASCVVDLAPGKNNQIVFNGGMSGFNPTGITVSLLPENAD